MMSSDGICDPMKSIWISERATESGCMLMQLLPSSAATAAIDPNQQENVISL